MAKLRAYELQDHGRDTIEANLELGYKADCRVFELPAQMLKQLNVPAVRLMTNNPEKVDALAKPASRSSNASPLSSRSQTKMPATSKPNARRWVTSSSRGNV